MHHERRMNRRPPGAGGRWTHCRRPARLVDCARWVTSLRWCLTCRFAELAGHQQPRAPGAVARHHAVRDHLRHRLRGRRRRRTLGPADLAHLPLRRASAALPRIRRADPSARIGHGRHRARRRTGPCGAPSPVALVSYALGQAGRARKGMAAIAGNHVVVALGPAGPYVAVVHLRHATVSVRPGDTVRTGRRIRGVRELGQQHPAPRARAGHRLHRLAGGDRPADAVSAPGIGRRDLAAGGVGDSACMTGP